MSAKRERATETAARQPDYHAHPFPVKLIFPNHLSILTVFEVRVRR